MLTLFQGTGIARILSSPKHGNLAVALLARRPESIQSVISTIRKDSPDAVLEAFPSDTSKASIEKAFQDIKSHKSFEGLKAEIAIYSVKHSSKKPFLEETRKEFVESLEEYVGGAFTFAQESIKRFYADHGEKALADGGEKKGVCNSIQANKCMTDTSRLSSSPAPSARYDAVRNSLRTAPVALPSAS